MNQFSFDKNCEKAEIVLIKKLNFKKKLLAGLAVSLMGLMFCVESLGFAVHCAAPVEYEDYDVGDNERRMVYWRDGYIVDCQGIFYELKNVCDERTATVVGGYQPDINAHTHARGFLNNKPKNWNIIIPDWVILYDEDAGDEENRRYKVTEINCVGEDFFGRLVSVSFPKYLEKISNHAFHRYSRVDRKDDPIAYCQPQTDKIITYCQLQKIDFGRCKDLKEIGDYAFEGGLYANYDLKGKLLNESSLKLDLGHLKKLQKIGARAFATNPNGPEGGVPSVLRELVLPENIEIIGDEAFHNSWYLEKVTINGVSKLKCCGSRVFDSCDRLENVWVIGEGSLPRNIFTCYLDHTYKQGDRLVEYTYYTVRFVGAGNKTLKTCLVFENVQFEWFDYFGVTKTETFLKPCSLFDEYEDKKWVNREGERINLYGRIGSDMTVYECPEIKDDDKLLCELGDLKNESGNTGLDSDMRMDEGVDVGKFGY